MRALQFTREEKKAQILRRDERRLSIEPGAESTLRSERLEAVRSLMEEGGFSGRQVIVVHPWDSLYVRNMRIPCVAREDREDVARYEACERFGLETEQAEIRHLSAGDVRQGTDTKHEIIAMGAARDRLTELLAELDRLKLDVVSIDPGPCALFRSFERYLTRTDDTHTITTLVDLGFAATRVLIARGDAPVFFKSIAIGSSAMMSEMSGALDVPMDTLDRLRRRTASSLHGSEGTPDPDDGGNDDSRELTPQGLRETLRPTAEQLAREIGLCLRYCSVTFRGLHPQGITLIGGGACDPILVELLKEYIAQPVHVGQCTRGIDVEKEWMNQDRRNGQPDWATAIGAGLKAVRRLEERVA